MTRNEYHVIGLMSGTSLDGLDVAECKFHYSDNWKFEIVSAKTFSYDEDWEKKLVKAHLMSGLQLSQLNADLGILHGKHVQEFITERQISPQFISSHGHTVFHQPEKSLTLQIGSAPHLAAHSGLPVVADFRSLDVALNGQGAPLVPIGDLLLFDEYDYCLNLGGIANISEKNAAHNEIRAFDICVCNMALNDVAMQLDIPFDNGGILASTGEVNEALLQELNAHPYYSQLSPKSLGREFFEKEIQPLLRKYSLHPTHKLATLNAYIAQQVDNALKDCAGKKILITGGGAYNHNLIDTLRKKIKAEIIVPDSLLVEFKEALIFAFLGVLRMRGEVNCLSAVTGASHDNCGGAIYYPSIKS